MQTATATLVQADALLSLVNHWQHLPPEYQGAFSNHLPMALHALHSLGADEARLHAFATHYVKRFEGAAALPGLVLPRWQDHRGDFARHADLRATFAQAITTQGAQQTLQQALPDLWPGVATAAFHGLIRTAHAWEMSHDGELASGLAYWAARWQPVRAQPPQDALPFAAWSALLSAQVGWSRPEGRSISGRIEQVQASAAFAQLSSRLLLRPDTLRQLAWFAAEQFTRSGNFTVLHMVTGCRAARVLLAAVPESAQLAMHGLVPAFTAAFLASGIEPQSTSAATATEARTWSEIVSIALRSDDEHVVKLVHAAVEEAAACGNPVYLQAARRATAQGAA
jgi:hypothetical protein